MATEKIFATGFSFKRNQNSPDFVVGKVSMKVDEAVAFIQSKQKNGWVNLDIKQGQGGNYYLELDTWEPQGTGNGRATSPSGSNYQHNPTTPDGGLPF